MSPHIQEGHDSQDNRESVDGVGPMCRHPLLGASPDSIVCHRVRGVPRHLANALLLPAMAAVHAAAAVHTASAVHAAMTAVHAATAAVPVPPEVVTAVIAGVGTAAEAAAAAPVGGSPDPLRGDRVVRLLGEVLSRVVFAGALLQQQRAPSISGAEQDDANISGGDEATDRSGNDVNFCDLSSDGGAEEEEEEEEDGSAPPGSIPAAIPLTSWVTGSSAAGGPLPAGGAEAPVSSTAQLQQAIPATEAGPLMPTAEVDQHTIHALSSPFCVIAMDPARCGE